MKNTDPPQLVNSDPNADQPGTIGGSQMNGVTVMNPIVNVTNPAIVDQVPVPDMKNFDAMPR